MRESRIRLLVLCVDYTNRLSYYDDWSDAFLIHPEFNTTVVNIASLGAKRRVKAESPAAMALYFFTPRMLIRQRILIGWSLFSRRVVALCSALSGMKSICLERQSRKSVQLWKESVQDWIATQLLHEAGQYLFGDLASCGVVSIPHALNPEAFRPNSESGVASHRHWCSGGALSTASR